MPRRAAPEHLIVHQHHGESHEHQHQRQHHLHLHLTDVTGAIPFFNPTHATYRTSSSSLDSTPTSSSSTTTTTTTNKINHRNNTTNTPNNVYRLYRSRDHRKGRHALGIAVNHNHQESNPEDQTPARSSKTTTIPTSSLRSTQRASKILHNLKRMLTTYPYWDLSYLVAVVFTLGSAIWIINAFFVWLPLQDPSTSFSGEEVVGGGWTAWVGAAVFEAGSVGLILEALGAVAGSASGGSGAGGESGGGSAGARSGDSESRLGLCCGWEEAPSTTPSPASPASSPASAETPEKESQGRTGEATLILRPSPQSCTCHHSNRKSILPSSLIRIPTHPDQNQNQNRIKFLVVDDYIHDLGFLASLTQLVGATIFWIAGFTGLPGIINHMSTGLTNGVYWVPQVVGGVCFVVSGGLFTLETQERWFRPAWGTLGWHVGVWNLVGGVGFTLCGVFGLAGMQYQACLATFWGSWAFLWASGLQWYESLEKWPVEKRTSLHRWMDK